MWTYAVQTCVVQGQLWFLNKQGLMPKNQLGSSRSFQSFSPPSPPSNPLLRLNDSSYIPSLLFLLLLTSCTTSSSFSGSIAKLLGGVSLDLIPHSQAFLYITAGVIALKHQSDIVTSLDSIDMPDTG